jgi:hypothetical protein
METSNISSAARHCTGTLNGHVIGGCIRMRLESASINQSSVAPLKRQSNVPSYQRSRALSRLVVVVGEARLVSGPAVSSQPHNRINSLKLGTWNFPGVWNLGFGALKAAS